MSMSNYLEAKLLEHVTGQATYQPPGSIWMGLFTDMPTDTGGPEVSSNGYARQEVHWKPVTNSRVINNQLIKFPAATAPWGTIRGFGLFDAAVGGHMLFHGVTSQPVEVNTGITFMVYAENLVIMLD